MNSAQNIFHLKGLLNPDTIRTIHQLLEKAPFVDGKNTASEAAKDVKRNLQVDANDREVMPQLQQVIGMALMNEAKFQTELYAARVYPFIFSCYQTKMGYGWHVDSPIMGVTPVRTDLAMTIFLSDPTSYEGGELIIRSNSGDISYKPAMGDAIVYPCQYVHCVNDVTSGTRLAAVSWIQCSVRSIEQRSLLADLKRVHHQLSLTNPQSNEAQSILQTWSNLLRMWADV